MLGYNINIRKGEQLHYCSSAEQLVTRERSVQADIKIFNHNILETGHRQHRKSTWIFLHLILHMIMD